MVKERPILFSGAMVQTILRTDNPKSQTRRVVKPTQSSPKIAPLLMEPWLIDGEQETDDEGLPCWVGYHHAYPTGEKWFSCPYGKAGDTLWVRESLKLDSAGVWHYAADDAIVSCDPADELAMVSWAHHKESAHCVSIHMPRWACRIRLRLTDVRVEQLQAISDADMRAEGLKIAPNGDPSTGFQVLWDGINGKTYPWESNPWVWALSFERID